MQPAGISSKPRDDISDLEERELAGEESSELYEALLLKYLSDSRSLEACYASARIPNESRTPRIKSLQALVEAVSDLNFALAFQLASSAFPEIAPALLAQSVRVVESAFTTVHRATAARFLYCRSEDDAVDLLLGRGWIERGDLLLRSEKREQGREDATQSAVPGRTIQKALTGVVLQLQE